MGISWSFEPRSDGVNFSVRDKSLLRSATIPLADWRKSIKPAEASGPRKILSLLEQEIARAEADGLLVPHLAVAELSETEALSLGLPKNAPFSFRLITKNNFTDENFHVNFEWRESGRSLALKGITRNGCIVTREKYHYRINDPLYSLVEAVEQFKNNDSGDRNARIALWSPIQDAVRRCTGHQVESERYLRGLTFYSAAAFGIDLEHGANGLRLEPLLFKSLASTSDDLTKDMGAEPGEPDPLLPSELQKLFVRDRFRQEGKVRNAYPLSDNKFVIFTPELQTALSVVKEVQAKSEEERRQFAANPRAAIASALGDKGVEVAATLFVETRGYSERVRGLGIWTKPVIPWLHRRSNQWLPEKCGLQIDGERIEFSGKELKPIREKVKEAIDKGQPAVTHGEQTIPATKSVLEGIDTLIKVFDTSPEAASGEEDPKWLKDAISAGQVIALDIQHNIEGEIARQVYKLRSLAIDGVDENLSEILTIKPYDHQLDGIRWLTSSWNAGYAGVLLADDMGLGKTLQSLAFLASLKTKQRKARKERPVLIVAPTSLLGTWKEEEGKWLKQPGLGECAEAYGPGLKRLRKEGASGSDIKSGKTALDVDQIRRCGWVLTTYETMAAYHPSFAKIEFSVVIFDEMQKIKSPDTLVTHGAKSLNANFVIGLTGTPIENSLTDLWCLFDRIEPGLLGSLKGFSGKYEENDVSALRALNGLLRNRAPEPDLLLRRMKADIPAGKALPKKSEQSRETVMPSVQADAYSSSVATARANKEKPTRGAILKVLQQLRSISLHPRSALEVFGKPDLYDEYVSQSARLSEAIKILDSVAEREEKALLFVEDIELQKFLSDYLADRYGLERVAIINGSVNAEKRQKIKNNFQSSAGGFDVLLLGPRAAGIGLTLTAANHVVHLSRWWNPALEDQCSDRAYRIGQTRPVTIYYPMAIHPVFGKDSFDARLAKLLERKRGLSREMLHPSETSGDAQALFSEVVGTADET